MNTDAKHISIFGVCVSRDIFGLHDNNGGYIIDRCIGGGVSPISAISEPTKCNDDAFHRQMDLLPGYSKFTKRNAYFNLAKNAFDFLSENTSDYFVIDMGAMRFPMMQNILNSREFFVLNDRKLLSLITPESFRGGYKTIDILEFDDETFKFYMDSFLNRITNQYSSSQIILIELKAVGFGITKEKERVFSFNEKSQKIIQLYNMRMNKSYTYVKEKLEGCHCIEFPSNVLANKEHKWGRGALHYVKEYYDYALEAIRIITDKEFNNGAEKKRLQRLRAEYSDLLWDTYKTR